MSNWRNEIIARTIHGKVHGKTIELNEDLGVAEGQDVEIQLRVVQSTKVWGDGLRRCAGALASEWAEDDDRILTEIYQDRKRGNRKDFAE